MTAAAERRLSCDAVTIRALHDEHGSTVEEIADMLGTDTTVVSLVLRGASEVYAAKAPEPDITAEEVKLAFEVIKRHAFDPDSAPHLASYNARWIVDEAKGRNAAKAGLGMVGGSSTISFLNARLSELRERKLKSLANIIVNV